MKKRILFTVLIVVAWIPFHFFLPDIVAVKNHYQIQALQMAYFLFDIIFALLLVINWLTLWRAK